MAENWHSHLRVNGSGRITAGSQSEDCDLVDVMPGVCFKKYERPSGWSLAGTVAAAMLAVLR